MEELTTSTQETEPTQSTSARKWYEGVSLEDAEIYIRANLKSAARSVIAIGYYLKCVYTKELYQEAGFKDVYEYAKDRFGFSTSTTSRYMSRNDKFSVDGNSPILDEKYKDFNKSQLQEMLSLDAEQLEQVTPDMTVVQIREMRKPKEIPYIEMPGQIELTDFPGVDPKDVAASVQARAEMQSSQPEKQTYTISAEDLLPEPAQPEREQPVAISQQKELITEPQSAVTQDAEKSGEAGSLPEKSGKCIHRPEFKCTLEEAYKLTPGTGEDCGCKCCWECVKHGNCEWECNSSLHRPEEPEKAKDYGTLETIGGVPVYSLKSKETVDGAYGWKRSQIVKEYLKKLHKEEAFTTANQIVPIEFQAAGNTYKAKYDGYCYVSFKSDQQTLMFVELDRLKAEYTVMYPPKKPKPVETYDGSILRSMIKFEKEEIDMMGPERIEKNPYNYTKHMMALEAYRMLLTAHEGGNVGIEQSGD